ncbi:hypothetical protein D3C79_915830 [compost metagenome]
MLVYAFYGHRGLIDKDTDGQSQAAQGHDINGLTKQCQQQDADQDGYRYGDDHDQAAPPVAQK